MKNLLIRDPSALFKDIKTVRGLGGDEDSRRRLGRDMMRANLLRTHQGWSRLTGRLLGHRPVHVRLDLPEAPDFWYRPGTSDLLVLDQIFLDGEYEYEELEGQPVEYVLDLGSNIGVTALFWANRFPDARIACVEPDRGNFQILEKNTAPFLDRAVLFHGAVAETCGELTFYNYGHDWSHSTVQRSSKAARGSTVVEGLTVDAVAERAGFPRIDLVKMDIEGAEADLIPTLDSWKYRPKFLAIELHAPYSFEKFARDVERVGYRALPSQDGPPRRRMPLAIRVD